ncbi:late competence protein ComER [Halalkalibacterium ligniniphilum]|uniref:late competence protein ComER n=1 Tax=Halalkalibacterium ligniniphilum TaxID=1134413 RepID=UPI0003485862|nr:late competence protein ComER [Halalkalibacterium ligniniphilum]
MKVGIIGTGSMGTILIESFLESGVISAEKLLVANRTHAKAEALARRFPKLQVAMNATEVVKETDCFFLCVKPPQFLEVLTKINRHCTANKLLVSITSPISVTKLEEMVDCKVARAIPSILNRAHTGPSLLSFGTRCSQKEKELLYSLMGAISNPLIIEENITRVASDIVSCGPAFFSYIMQRFIEAAERQTQISKEDATRLATDMLIGMGRLLEKEVYSLPTLQKRVCVPGGITGEGIKVLEEEIGSMFDHLFQQTHLKYDEEKEKILAQLSNKPT